MEDLVGVLASTSRPFGVGLIDQDLYTAAFTTDLLPALLLHSEKEHITIC